MRSTVSRLIAHGVTALVAGSASTLAGTAGLGSQYTRYRNGTPALPLVDVLNRTLMLIGSAGKSKSVGGTAWAVIAGIGTCGRTCVATMGVPVPGVTRRAPSSNETVTFKRLPRVDGLATVAVTLAKYCAAVKLMSIVFAACCAVEAQLQAIVTQGTAS